MNLLKETIEALERSHKRPEDVLWVGSSDGKYDITWDEFVAIADIEYSAGYGSQEIAEDLVIVGADWWLARWEYDGSEGWVFRTQPVKSDNAKTITTVKARDLEWRRLSSPPEPDIE